MEELLIIISLKEINHFPIVRYSDGLTNQPFPYLKPWNLWRRMVRKVFNINENDSLPIHQHLTQWIIQYSLRQMQHRWNFWIEKEKVYEIHNSNVHYHFTVKNKVLTFKLNLESKQRWSTLPQGSITISFIRGNYVFLHKAFTYSTPSPIKLKLFQ